jgi:hypothetical protein
MLSKEIAKRKIVRIYLFPTLQKRKLNIDFRDQPINAIKINSRSYFEYNAKRLNAA